MASAGNRIFKVVGSTGAANRGWPDPQVALPGPDDKHITKVIITEGFMPDQSPAIALALQGGGSHGAFTWGVLDRLLLEVAAGRLRISAVSGTSAGALNAALTVSGLVQGGATGGA